MFERTLEVDCKYCHYGCPSKIKQWWVRPEVTEEKNTRKCKVCGKAISKQDREDFEDMCWECWDDQLTEESDSMFDELM